MTETQKLEELIETTQKQLSLHERERLFTPDPEARQKVEQEIEHLQRELFQHRKLLAALSGDEPLPKVLSDTSRPHVFISYSHADKEWLDRLLSHLQPIRDIGVLDFWDDTRIAPGSRWREEAEIALKAAKAVILLVSADFLASDFIAERELPFLIEAAQKRGVLICSIVLSPCRFARTPLAQFQAINSPSSPLTSKSKHEQERILSTAAEVIRKAVAAGRTGLESTKA